MADELYGGYALKRGDKDGNSSADQPQLPTWGGNSITQAIQQPKAQTPQQNGATVSAPEYVQDLQRDLRVLGFLIIKGDDREIATDRGVCRIDEGMIADDGDNGPGKFGRTTEWAVKEFQIYASMSHVAKFNPVRLEKLSPGSSRLPWKIGALGEVRLAPGENFIDKISEVRLGEIRLGDVKIDGVKLDILRGTINANNFNLAYIMGDRDGIVGKINLGNGVLLGDIKLGELNIKSSIVRVGGVMVGDVRVGEAKVRVGEIKFGDVRIGEGNLGNVRVGGIELGNVKLGDVMVEIGSGKSSRLGDVKVGKFSRFRGDSFGNMAGLFEDKDIIKFDDIMVNVEGKLSRLGNIKLGDLLLEVRAVEGVTQPPVSYYVASLDQVKNTAPYKGPISGVVNKETRAAIRHWLKENYRCPVVIEAWKTNTRTKERIKVADGSGGWSNGVNLWHYDHVNTSNTDSQHEIQMFSRDFTKYYSYPFGRDSTQYQVVGKRTRFAEKNKPIIYGPICDVPNHVWSSDTEMMPEMLMRDGTTLADLQNDQDSAKASTFRVYRAASEQENKGHFDGVNAYDRALVSLGPCHWTMTLRPNETHYTENGELSGFLAYVLTKFQNEYRKAIGDFGLYPATNWSARNQVAPRGSGTMWSNIHRKYTGWYRQHKEGISPAQAVNSMAILEEVSKIILDTNYYKTWHWFFRLVMMGRCFPGVRQCMWDMTRMRIQDIRDVQISVTVGNITINATIGEIFTSEKAIALLLRWHIYMPGHVTTGSRIKNVVQESITQNPALNWGLPLSNWTNQHETALTTRLFQAANAVNDTQSRVNTWPNYVGRGNRFYVFNQQLGSIRTGRDSFKFDTDNL